MDKCKACGKTIEAPEFEGEEQELCNACFNNIAPIVNMLLDMLEDAREELGDSASH